MKTKRTTYNKVIWKRFILVFLFIASGVNLFGDEKNHEDKDLWLSFNFNSGLNPSGGYGKTTSVKKVVFSRPFEVLRPENKIFKSNQPCLVKGKFGQSLYLGAYNKNLLSAELSDFSYSKDAKTSVSTLYNAKIFIRNKGFFGNQSLAVNANGVFEGGISIPFTIEGGEGKSKGKMKVSLFSFYIKGKGFIKVTATIKNGITSGEKKLLLSKKLNRVTMWLASNGKSKAKVKIVNLLGLRCKYIIDGLKLENTKMYLSKQNLEKKKNCGSDYSATAWIKGGNELSNIKVLDSFFITLIDKDQFPVKEGTISVWIKPDFNQFDAMDHNIISLGSAFYSLMYQCYNRITFFRCNNKYVSGGKIVGGYGAVGKSRPKLKRGEWGVFVATWSNKNHSTRLYYNGELIGECNSLYKADKISTKISTYLKTLTIGSYAGNSLNGTIDELKIYSRALTSAEIKAKSKNNK